jgi:hypothetical protein
MPKNISNLSNEPDPYSFEHYPKKFAVKVGHQTHNARQLLRAAKYKHGALMDMYRQPIPSNTVDEIYRKTGHIYKDGSWKKRRQVRRAAKRELRRRQGLSDWGPSSSLRISTSSPQYNNNLVYAPTSPAYTPYGYSPPTSPYRPSPLPRLFMFND